MHLALALITCVLATALCEAAVLIDEGAGTPRDERQEHAAWLGFRPADGQVCEINPPRFSWPYHPSTVVPADHKQTHSFALQVSKKADMSDTVVEVKETPYNFYNALPVLQGGPHWFWRVGYDVGTEREQWSRVRAFTMWEGTPEWDRSVLAELDEHLQGHPRIIFKPENLEELRALKDMDEESARLYEACVGYAHRVMEKPWFTDMPAEDPLVPMAEQGKAEYTCVAFRDMARDMAVVAMAYMLSGDEKYLAVREPLLVLASYPAGGESSPEGLGPSRKWATKITMDMGLCFDWLYAELTEEQREQIGGSLGWRIEHIFSDFSWARKGVPHTGGLAMRASSHAYEDYLWTLVGALATYEHSEVAREFCEMGLNYLVGVTNGFGWEEAWNEGLSYGNWKCATLLDATCYAAMTLPELHLERNPFYRRIGSFFSYLSPVGMERSAWGNYGTSPVTHLGGHLGNFRRLAFLTGDGTFLQNWLACVELREGNKGSNREEYPLPHFLELPEPALEETNARLFNTAGWAMAFSGPPSDPATYRDGVGIVFHSRPRGGYSHSFDSENAFELFAYGSVIATGGGRKTNGDAHARATMSHNSVLVDGLGQRFDHFNPEIPTAGRIIAWHEEPGLVYWCADATGAYLASVPYLERFLRHVLFVDEQFFVIFDDLAVAQEHEPARFSWLYHVHQDVPVQLAEDEEGCVEFSYQVREANVQVRHLIGQGELEVQNLRGEDGYKNPITGEDMLDRARQSVERSPLRQFTGEPVWNNIWLTTRPAREAQFLAAVLPSRGEQPPASIELLGDRTFAIVTPQGRRTIRFGRPGEAEADITVDYERVRMLAGTQLAPEPGGEAWEADLSDTSGWKLDGEGTVEHLPGGVLRITTETPTVYWADQVVEAPLLIDLEVRTEDPGCRAILFFMAEGMNGEDIFAWERTGDYGDYAYTERMELHTVGLMRQGCGTESNFRSLGGKLPEHLRILQTPRDQLTDEQRAAYSQAVRDFQPATIPSTTCDGYELGRWMRYQVLVDGHLIRVWADGRLLHEVIDPDPLTRGRIGFRNFGRGTAIEVRKLSVSRLTE
jgi:hypothetical protein